MSRKKGKEANMVKNKTKQKTNKSNNEKKKQNNNNRIQL